MKTPDRIGRRGSFADATSPSFRRPERVATAQRSLVIFLAVVGYCAALRADPPKLCELIPSDASAFVYFAGSDPLPTGGGSGVALAGMLVDHARALGLLAEVDQSTRLWIDGLAALPLVMGRSAALVLMDIDAGPIEGGGHRFRSGRFALILDVGDDDAEVRSRIQHLLNSHTNQQDSSIRHTTTGGRSWYTLVDRRLPDWAEVEWGRLGGAFVVTLGRGAMEGIRGTFDQVERSTAREAWFRAAIRAASPHELHDLWFADFARITGGMDAELRRKVESVLRSLRLVGVERALWAVGRDGRAVEAACYLRRDGGDRVEAIAGLRFAKRVPEGVVPREATSFAIIDTDPGVLIGGVCDAYLAARSPAARRKSRAFWRGLQADAGVDIQREILDRLTGPMIIHDHPLNAFRIPLFKTILIGIEGDPAPVRTGIDRFLFHVRRLLGEDASFLNLTRDFDGVWYVSFGIYGPALLVTNDRIIISFSPLAVRQNAMLLQGNTATTGPHDDPAEGG
jgi:hypothetical protein